MIGLDLRTINNGSPLYVAEDISFCNTSEFSEAAKYFKKNGVYTKAPEGTKEFNDFWDIQEDRCLNGMTLPGKLVDGKLQDVHITGEHYFFLNFNQLIRTVDSELAAKELVKGGALLKHARKVGKKDVDFPDFWDGHYHFFKSKQFARAHGLHLAVSKGRRKGFSYLGGSASAHKYTFFPNRTVVIGAFDNKYLLRGDGTMVMAKNYLDFVNQHTDWYKNRLIDRADHVKSGFKYRGRPGEHGFKSQIIAVSFGPDNPDAAIGKDAEEIQFEEAGKFPNLLESLDVTIPTLEDGDVVTGIIIVYGTGGTKEANWEDFEKIFFNPALYGFMAFENIWDDNARGTVCSFFFPHQQNLVPHIDEHGNSKTEDALAAMDILRDKKKATADTPADYRLYIGQRPKTPKEAFSRTSNNYFYSPGLEDHFNKVTRDPDIQYLHTAGKLYRSEKGVVIDQKAAELTPPIFDFPLKTRQDGVNRHDGCYVEWQAPYRDHNGRVPAGLYYAMHDPYATDKDAEKISVRDSFGALYIYEKTNRLTASTGDILVASYFGRPESVEMYNEQLFLALERWNAKMLFENDRGDVIPHAKKNKLLDYLFEEPELDWKKELASTTGRNWGIHMTDARILAGAKYLKDWLYAKRATDENGNSIFNYHYIYDAGLLAELMKWNLKGNFDRVSAMLVGQYLRQEVEYIGQMSNQEPEEEDPNDYFNRRKY